MVISITNVLFAFGSGFNEMLLGRLNLAVIKSKIRSLSSATCA